jgi:hypothetical protein
LRPCKFDQQIIRVALQKEKCCFGGIDNAAFSILAARFASEP